MPKKQKMLPKQENDFSNMDNNYYKKNINNKDIYSTMHPVMELLGSKSNRLSGKKIALGITGSIAAVQTVKLAHELIRHGAEVYPVLTEAACNIISPNALFYASGKPPITKLTGKIEHISLCGQVKDKIDLLLIAPCTANTISKIACGIDDTTVTTFATTAIGSKIPILLVPAMHASMYEHSIIQENIKKLADLKINIEFIPPVKTENKWKLASVDTIVSRVIRRLWKTDLSKKRILVIAGATAENIDDMRILTNRSTGYTGVALSMLAYLRGADVDLWLGKSSVEPPEYLYCSRFDSIEDLTRKVMELKNSGKSGFKRNQITGKLPSGKKKLKLELVPTTKIIKLIRENAPKSFVVGFKAEVDLPEKKMIEKAKARMKDWKLDLMVANDLIKVTKDSNQIIILHPNKKYVKVKGKKEFLAERIFDEILKR